MTSERQLERLVSIEFSGPFETHGYDTIKGDYIDGEAVVRCPIRDCSGRTDYTLRCYGGRDDAYGISDDWHSQIDCSECGVVFTLPGDIQDEIQHRLNAYVAQLTEPTRKS